MAFSTETALAKGAINSKILSKFQEQFASDARNLQSMNAVAGTPVNKVALNRRKASKVSHAFSVHLPENKATAQMSSGRCWLFAALNVLRPRAIKAMNLGDDFEFSQNYVLFWDKFEKANYFLEAILSTLDEPVGSRLLDHLLLAPVQDGGQWHMFVNLVRKYGVVPKSVMPETESSSSTGQMSFQITGKLREYACRLRDRAAAGDPESDLRAEKERFLAEVYRILCIHLGEPPSEFLWQWRDKDKKFTRAGQLTPQEFFEKYVGLDLSEFVCLIHDPRPMHEFNRTYTVKYLGNVVEGEPIVYLNVDADLMKRAAIGQLQDQEPVWFGCDVGKYLDRDLGVMDPELFNFDLVYGTEHRLNKAERLMYGHSAMTHAMVFTGVDLDESGAPLKWRVENSWSEKPGDKGFFQMSDRWFDEFNYEVVVRKEFVPEETLRALEEPPVELDPWDPMGSLA